MNMFVSVDPMSLGDAALVSLVGFSVVFVALIALMVFIHLIRAVTERKQSPPAPAATPASPTAPKIPAVGSLGEIDLHTVDDRTAAMLMAIVADKLKAPLNELRFLSIKEI